MNSSFISVDCAWHPWESWGPCSVTCGGGVANRTRSVERQAQFGGASCGGASAETSQCKPQGCPGENVFSLEEHKVDMNNIR